MYKYIYVEAKARNFWNTADHRQIINQYSKEGWRFVSAIPTASGAQGAIVRYDLVFEKEE